MLLIFSSLNIIIAYVYLFVCLFVVCDQFNIGFSVWMFIYLFVCLCFKDFVCVFLLSVCLPDNYKSVHLCTSVCLCLSVFLSVFLSVCLHKLIYGINWNSNTYGWSNDGFLIDCLIPTANKHCKQNNIEYIKIMYKCTICANYNIWKFTWIVFNVYILLKNHE